MNNWRKIITTHSSFTNLIIYIYLSIKRQDSIFNRIPIFILKYKFNTKSDKIIKQLRAYNGEDDCDCIVNGDRKKKLLT